MTQLLTAPDGNAYRMRISPETARQFLATSPGNRKIRDDVVRRYAVDMKSGKWYVGNDAVILDDKNRLRNAHHRLTAVILSGCTVEMLVRSGVQEEEIASMDQGLIRTPVDSLTGFGGEKRFGDVSNRDVYTIKMLIFGNHGRELKMSNEVIGEAVRDHRKLLDFVFDECFDGCPRSKMRGITTPVFAVFVRAAYNDCYRDKLIYAGRYLLDGGDSVETRRVERIEGTSSLKLLFTFLKMDGSKNGGSARKLIYNVTENLLFRFLNGFDTAKLSKNIRELYEEQFPIPDKNYLNSFSRFSLPKVNYEIALCNVAKRYHHEQLITPQEVANDMISDGLKIDSSNPAKIVSTWFCKLVKQNGKFSIIDVGTFVPEISKVGQKRINHYRFFISTHKE